VDELDYKLPSPPPVSIFASGLSIPTVRSTESSEIFQQAFVRFGRVSHLLQVLAMHPTYASKFSDCMHTIMYGSGPLPRPWRAYIAAMAGAAARCPYIVSRQVEAFLADGGDETWLTDIEAAPVKLQRLAELNNLLMVRPWAISEDTIAHISQGTGGDAMNAGEIVHAMVILTSYHSISSLVWGMGVQPEVDMLFRSSAPATPNIKTQHLPSAPPSISSPLGIMSSRPSASAAGNGGPGSADAPCQDELPFKDLSAEHDELMDELLKETGISREQVQTLQVASSESAIVSPTFTAAGPAPTTATPPASSTCGLDCAYSAVLFREVIAYRDFNIKEGVLRTRDFSWAEHGYPLLNRYFATATTQVDDIFSHTFSLTYHTLGSHTNLDTSPYRTAVWYMVHRLFGITNDDYQYSDINRFLKVPTKRYIKRLVTTPWLLRRDDYNAIVGGMTDGEKCHINLLALEAKKQASIMYALSSVVKHFA